MPFTSSWKKNAMRQGPARGQAGRCAPARGRRAPSRLSRSSQSAARDQLVLAGRVDLEQEELTVDHIPVGVELDRLPEDRGRLVRLLDLRQHVGAAGVLARLADGRVGP